MLSDQEKQRRLDRPCKQCGRPINKLDVRQVVCSNECARRSRVKKFSYSYECKNCGNLTSKEVHPSRLPVCCSNKCQKSLAQKSMALKRTDMSRSIKAKDSYRKNSSKQRSLKYRAISKALTKLIERSRTYRTVETEESRWKRKIAVRLQGTKWRRPSFGFKFARKETSSYLTKLSRLKSKRAWFNTCPWIKKLTNKMANMGQRRRRKHEASRSRKQDLQKAN